MPNPYPARFRQLLNETDGPVLDCGAGGRTHRKIVSVDIEPHRTNTARVDALGLPFRDDAFALVLSQAVIEHVTDPQRYVDEIHRVLKPGGLLWAEVAFLQPVHCAPTHYFNCTPYGLAYLCRRFEVLETGTIGTLVEQWTWLLRETGAKRALSVADDSAMKRALRKVDDAITPTGRENTASGVSLLGRKP